MTNALISADIIRVAAAAPARYYYLGEGGTN
jgi:hypothetical protein